MNWLDHEELIKTLNENEKGKWKTSTGLTEVLSGKIKPQYNETILWLQYHKLIM